jgi:hypothetical protein
MSELILPPTRSPGTAASSLGAALIVVILAVALIADPVVSDGERVAVTLLGALFAVTLTAVGVTLLRGHGALLLDSQNQRIGLGITRLGDIWWIPLAEIEGLQVLPLAQPDKDMVERWLLVLGLRERPEVVLAESDDRGAIMGICQRLAERLAIAELGADARSPAQSKASVRREERFAVSRGAALQGLVTVFGASLVAVAVLGFSEVQREPVVGFIFAPILIVMGVALLIVPLVKRLANESLSFDGARWTHAYEFHRWRWGTRTVRATSPRFRLRLLGIRGGLLELVGDDGVLVLAAGATSRSKLDLDAIARIPSRFASS